MKLTHIMLASLLGLAAAVSAGGQVPTGARPGSDPTFQRRPPMARQRFIPQRDADGNLIRRSFQRREAPRIENPDFTKTNRPATADRLFVSTAIEREIKKVKSLLTNPKLAWMFENCFPNTLDTTVHFEKDENGKNDTFVYTGDIHAMWLRDSGAQVWPYVQFVNEDKHLKDMIEGVIRRQFKCINIDPYANAFNKDPIPDEENEYITDRTRMTPLHHERKWELDSPCYPVRLAYEFWKKTGDTSVFDEIWVEAAHNIVATLKDQQRKEGLGQYSFIRAGGELHGGYGSPVNPVGLVACNFRPSDDYTVLLFLVPSNFFAVTSLRKMAEILTVVNKDKALAAECTALADEIHAALMKYAVVDHPDFGPVYAYEVDGFGGRILMDDSNIPSLLGMAYLGDVPLDDPVYQNTRRMVWSKANPYFFKGEAGEGIGGPHCGYDMIWPMTIIMKAMTAGSDEEIRECLTQLIHTDANTGFMHESFHKDNPFRYTRSWFAWPNTLFGELIVKLVNDGKVGVLNSIE